MMLFFFGYYQIEPASLTVIEQWGAPGAIIVAEGVALAWLYKQLTGRIKEKDQEIAKLNIELRDRLTESLKIVIDTMNDSSLNIEKLAMSINELEKVIDLEKIIALADRLNKLNSNK